jgi:hypothetical protein
MFDKDLAYNLVYLIIENTKLTPHEALLINCWF